MSNRKNSMVETIVEAVPLPAAVVRAQAAGEMVKACKGSDREVEIAQTGVARSEFQSVQVIGVDANGVAREAVEMSFSDDGSGKVSVDMDGGRRSALEALDGSLARMVDHQARQMERKGLTADVRYEFNETMHRDDEKLRRRREEYGIAPSPLPSWGDGYEPRETMRARPARDQGTMVTMRRRFPRDR